MISISYSIDDILKKQRDEFKAFRAIPYVARSESANLEQHLDSPLIKVVMGPRRSGKSRLIQKILEDKQVAYLNFDDDIVIDTPGELLIEAAQRIYPNSAYWYFDEIQNFPRWETLLNKLHRRGFNIVVTGSNAKLLSSELATALTGRHVAVELFPFSYTEYCRALTVAPSWATFSDYQHRGGLPEVVLGGARDPLAYISALLDSIVLKDIVQRKKIRNPEYLSNTLSLLLNNIASRTSARALSRALHDTPSPTTIEKYLIMAREAYLIETITPFSFKTKERLLGERKPYAIDTGFVTAKSQPILSITDKLLENAVYLELRRRGYVPHQSLYTYRSAEGREVDFLVRTGHQTTQLIQVCQNMTALETKMREVTALATAQREHPNAEILIVTADESGTISLPGENGQQAKNMARLVPVWEFCSDMTH